MLNPRVNPDAEEREPPRPKGALDPARLAQPINTRLGALFNSLAQETKWDQKLRGVPFWLGWRLYVRPKRTSRALEAINTALRQHELL
jgi:hypothetical protein